MRKATDPRFDFKWWVYGMHHQSEHGYYLEVTDEIILNIQTMKGKTRK